MPIIGQRVTVGTTATILITPTYGSTNDPITGSLLNLGSQDVDLGGAGVVAGSGYLLRVPSPGRRHLRRGPHLGGHPLWDHSLWDVLYLRPETEAVVARSGTNPTQLGVSSTTGSGPVIVEQFQTDIFGAPIQVTRHNQVSLKFFASLPSTDEATQATTNGGTVTQSAGNAHVTSGVNVSGTASITSVPVVKYRAGFEIYFWGTASFTTPTHANSSQYFGLLDANNGYAWGYQGLTFGFLKRTGGVDTFTALSAGNGDHLTGAVGSSFTRDGVPEALDKTKLNVYRIRYGWFGSAPTIFEVLSPDGDWVVANTFRNPNSSTTPHIQNPNLPTAIQVTKASADATSLTINSGCSAAGSTSELPSGQSAAVTSIVAATTAVTLSAADPDRQGVIIYNNSNAVLYCKFGSGASSSSFTVAIPSNSLFDFTPLVTYKGIISGVWSTSNGNAQVTEVN